VMNGASRWLEAMAVVAHSAAAAAQTAVVTVSARLNLNGVDRIFIPSCGVNKRHGLGYVAA
jgi:hypothetical protein